MQKTQINSIKYKNAPQNIREALSQKFNQSPFVKLSQKNKKPFVIDF